MRESTPDISKEREIIYRPSLASYSKYAPISRKIGDPMPKGAFATKEEAIQEQIRRDEEQENRRKQYESIATERLDKIENEIYKTLSQNGASMYMNYHDCSDMHGVYDLRMTILVDVNGFSYERDLDL